LGLLLPEEAAGLFIPEPVVGYQSHVLLCRLRLWQLGSQSSLAAAASKQSEGFRIFAGKLPGKLLEMLLLLALSRVGVYLPLPGVNVDAFASSIDKVSPPPGLNLKDQGP
jgi:hypothetical protein